MTQHALGHTRLDSPADTSAFSRASRARQQLKSGSHFMQSGILQSLGPASPFD